MNFIAIGDELINLDIVRRIYSKDNGRLSLRPEITIIFSNGDTRCYDMNNYVEYDSVLATIKSFERKDLEQTVKELKGQVQLLLTCNITRGACPPLQNPCLHDPMACDREYCWCEYLKTGGN